MPKGETDCLSSPDATKLLSNLELLKLSQSENKEGCVPFWVPESLLDCIELEVGDAVRLKTCGNSPFVGKSVWLFFIVKL